MKGKVEAVCKSASKGGRKVEVGVALLKENWGIEGDAHAGDPKRQISLLPVESVERLEEAYGLNLKPGDFGENILTRGVELRTLTIGDQIQIGQGVLLEVTQMGKECPNPCIIQKQTSQCIMPTEGVFAKVVHGDKIRKGSRVRPVK